jgi:type I site-specific restriction-modification system R (restriction) subunit
MARAKKNNQKKTNNGANVGYEAELWQMADALRGSMDAAEYKHVVLGLIFLKYISDAFEEHHAKLEAEKAQGADPEDPDEYRALNIFWVRQRRAGRTSKHRLNRPRSKTQEELDFAVCQIVSRAVAPEGVMDIFAAAGLQRPDISILSDEFLAEVRDMPHRNLAVELLRKLLSGEIQTRRKKNVVQARSFAEMLEQSIRKYQNRAIEAAQVIEEMIGLAKDMRQANERGEALKLSEEELAFYDALETNDSAVQVLGDETLRTIAREVTVAVRNNVTIDWTLRENVRAQLRVIVKRILRKYGYPPDKQEKATQTVLEQVEVLGWEVAA